MSVPFIDLSQQYETVKDEIDVGLKSVFQKANFILGEEEKQFESEFANFCDLDYAVGVNSGTDALYLALSALDIGPGDEVILPAFTFIATALCISYTGAKPVFVDIKDDTYNIDPQRCAEAITDKTKAIIPVHIYGQSADMKEILEVAQKHNLKVIEDAAQAHGAKYQDQRIGSLGDIGCFSFYPTKALGAFGDGGIVTTKDKDLYEKILMLRDYGRSDRYAHKIKGYNSRLDTVQAVIVSAKLKHLDEWNGMRAQKAQHYNTLLKDFEGVTSPMNKDDRTHIYQTYAIRVNDRDRVCKQMQKNGIGVLIHYPIPLPLQEAYKDLGHKPGDFPVSEEIAGEILSLPMFPHISNEQIEEVCSTLKNVQQKAGEAV